MSRVITALVLVFLTGRARSEPEVERLASTEGPFDNAFEDKCRSMGAVECKRIMSARTAPFERVELHEAGGWGYVVIEHEGRWFVGPPSPSPARVTRPRASASPSRSRGPGPW